MVGGWYARGDGGWGMGCYVMCVCYEIMSCGGVRGWCMGWVVFDVCMLCVVIILHAAARG